MKTLDELDQGLILSLLGLREVYASLPFLVTYDKLEQKAITQLLEASDVAWLSPLNHF